MAGSGFFYNHILMIVIYKIIIIPNLFFNNYKIVNEQIQ